MKHTTTFALLVTFCIMVSFGLLGLHCSQNSKPAETKRFVIRSIKAETGYIALREIKDTKTGRLYIMSSDGGPILEVEP